MKFVERLVVLESNALLAANKVMAALAKQWPVGSPIQCLLSHRQKNFSTGEVICHFSDGRIRVGLLSLNRRGNRTSKNVHWSRCK